MIIYILYAIILLVLLAISKNGKYIFIPILLLFALNSFRGYHVGTDYVNYYNSYKDFAYFFYNYDVSSIIENFGKTKNNEIGWGVLNYFAITHRMPFYIVNLFTITIITFFIYYSIRQQSVNRYLSLFLFFMLGFYFSTFNILRNSISVAIFIYSIKYIIEKKLASYLLFCFLASMFHTTALILPFLYFLRYVKINHIVITSLLILSLIIPVIGLDKKIMSIFIDENALNVYSHYFEAEGNLKLNITGKFVSMFLLIIQSAIFVYCSFKIKSNRNIYIALWLTGLLIQNITINYSWLFRISGYFLIVQIIVIPFVLFNDESFKIKKNISYYIIVAYSIFIFSIRMFLNLDGVVPYETIF